MSSDHAAISVRGLGKRYRIGSTPEQGTLAAQLRERLRAPLRRSGEVFTALEDVTFDVLPGQVLGVIGRNGAGKSTLLKILTRVTPPTSGAADIRGSVGSLLEVGTGFHPELTGRENIYLNGAVLGMSGRQVSARFDDIVAFAGVQRFLDTPVKRYSSGMYVRLAFALAAHLDADVLLIDEVLAVGDQEFQERSLSKMRSVAKDGRTVVLVSHQLNTVAALCDRTLYLRGGRVAALGPTEEVVAGYLQDARRDPDDLDLEDYEHRPGTGEVRLVALREQSSDAVLELSWRVRCLVGTEVFYLAVHVVDNQGLTVLQCDSRLVHPMLSLEEGEEATGSFRLAGPALLPGRYRVDAFVCRPSGLVDVVEDALRVDASPLLPYPYATSPDAIGAGTVLADFSYALSRLPTT